MIFLIVYAVLWVIIPLYFIIDHFRKLENITLAIFLQMMLVCIFVGPFVLLSLKGDVIIFKQKK